MQVAVFESEPQASAAATTLRELGANAEVHVPGTNTWDERVRDFFSGKPVPCELHAIVLSRDAYRERFLRIVQRHYGTVVDLGNPAIGEAM